MSIDPKLSGRILRSAQSLDDLVRLMEAEQAARQAALEAGQARRAEIDADLMKACRAIALASDQVAQCKFAGVSEFQARRRLDAAIGKMTAAMQKHGRGGL